MERRGMDVLSAVKYSRLSETEPTQNQYTCVTTNYGTSSERHQSEVNGHINPLDLHTTEYPPSNENDLIRIHRPFKDRSKMAILAAIFCFFPTGIAALIFARKAKSAWLCGYREDAREKSRLSRDLIRASVCIGCFFYVLLFLFLLFVLIFHVQ